MSDVFKTFLALSNSNLVLKLAIRSNIDCFSDRFSGVSSSSHFDNCVISLIFVEIISCNLDINVFTADFFPIMRSTRLSRPSIVLEASPAFFACAVT